MLSRSELKGNQADGQGGAVTLMSCAANLDEVSLVGNSAKLSGGCIFAGIDKTNNTIAQPAGSGKTANYTVRHVVQEGNKRECHRLGTVCRMLSDATLTL